MDEREGICECGHSKNSHCWRPYGSAKKYMRCHKKNCKCYHYRPKEVSLLSSHD